MRSVCGSVLLACSELALCRAVAAATCCVHPFQIENLSSHAPTDVFTEFSKPDVGIGSSALIFMLGLLMSAFTLTG